MALAAAAVAGSATMGVAGQLSGQAIQNSFQEHLVDRGEQAFTSAGLPKFLYYNNSNNGGINLTPPDSKFHLGGSNYQIVAEGSMRNPGIISNDFQQIFHTGAPRQTSHVQFPPLTQNNQRTFASQKPSVPTYGNFVQLDNIVGQNDRTGLGAGRYSAVPPPPNNVSTQSYMTGDLAMKPPNTFNTFSKTQFPKTFY